MIEIIISLIVGVALGVILMYITGRATNRTLTESLARESKESAAKSERIVELSSSLASREAEMKALNERIGQHAKEVEDLQNRFRTEFKNLANDILEEKSRQFKQTNRESLDILLKPFKDNIESFRKRVEEVYDKEAQQRFSLNDEIKNLNEMNRRMSIEATNLTNALKGDSKVQGDWGEMILETILDNSNLRKGIHYFTQETIKDEHGSNLRPDVILSLPEGKQIVIDSKVSITAYTNYTQSETAEERSRYLKEHIRSIRAHIDELGSKRYQTLVNSPDFVIMFVPTEPAFLLALQHDNTIWGDAYKKKVIISSPTNLFALLKIVDDLWKRDNQSKNALKIAEAGANLYDKFASFASTLTDLGKNIDAASKNYEKAYKQLKEGKGNLISRAEQLRELGVKASKQMPTQLADYDE